MIFPIKIISFEFIRAVIGKMEIQNVNPNSYFILQLFYLKKREKETINRM